MNNRFFWLLLMSLATPATAQHALELETNLQSFGWQEFGINKGERQLINEEEGELVGIGLAYSYSQHDKHLKVSFQSTNGDVNYLGAGSNSPFGTKSASNTRYTLQQIESEYGATFDVASIKPYAAILGGYQARERIIAASPGFSNRTAEAFRFWFWGARLEAEVFSYKGFSVDIGSKFTRTVGGKNQSIDERYVIPLQSLITGELYARVHYQFLPSWKASMMVAGSAGKMDASREIKVPFEVPGLDDASKNPSQPESEQRNTAIHLRLTKTF